MKTLYLLLLATLSSASCRKGGEPTPTTPDTNLYFPTNSGSTWETTTPSQLGWNPTAIADLKTFLAQKNSKSFMILVNGRIVMEEYFNGHTALTEWEWNSAGKTLISTTTGIAQQESLLNIGNKASDYLGTGWTSMPSNKENLITVKTLLT